MTAAASRRTAWATNTLQGLDVVCRYLALNVLWIISCALVLTAAAGTKAMLETTKNWASGDETPVLKTFAAHFRRNAVSTTAAAAPLAALGMLLVFNLEIASHTGAQQVILLPALAAVAIPYAIFTACLLPANLGQAGGVKAAYGRTLAHIVTSPTAAALTVAIALAACFIIYVQPYAVFLIAAPAARLAVAASFRSTKPSTT